MEGAGLLDRCIRVESRSLAQDSYGEALETFTIVESCRAGVKYLRATEPFQGDQFNAQRRVRFTIRWRSGIDETCRIIYNGDTYDIQGVSEQGRRQWLLLDAIALVPTA